MRTKMQIMYKLIYRDHKYMVRLNVMTIKLVNFRSLEGVQVYLQLRVLVPRVRTSHICPRAAM